jgi:hypothetical protein
MLVYQRVNMLKPATSLMNKLDWSPPTWKKSTWLLKPQFSHYQGFISSQGDVLFAIPKRSPETTWRSLKISALGFDQELWANCISSFQKKKELYPWGLMGTNNNLGMIPGNL